MEQLDIQWTMSDPPVGSRMSHSWKPYDFLGSSKIFAPEGLGFKSLGWDNEAFAILQHAFSLNLNRFTSWDIAALPVALAHQARLAGSVYKRGVDVGQPTREWRGHYPILLSHDLHHLSEFIVPDALLIVDEAVEKLWSHLWIDLPRLVLNLTERSKNLQTVDTILEDWHSKHRPPQWVVIGGGLLTDVAGFACGIAGCEMTLMPTTLLAMVDASIGGKTGVNSAEHGKNQIGLFAFPKKVVIATPFLSTLPLREVRAGAAECYKHALLAGDRAMLARIVTFSSNIGKPDQENIPDDLLRLIHVKAEIVQQDPAEENVRATLNLGHTLAHALEALSNGAILHGEAVAYGLAFMAFLSHVVVALTQDDLAQICSDLQRGNLISGAEIDAYDARRLYEIILKDKKRQSGEDLTDWVLLKSLGTIATAEGSSRVTVAVTYQQFLQAWEMFVEWLNNPDAGLETLR